jgi:hypothetical protein
MFPTPFKLITLGIIVALAGPSCAGEKGMVTKTIEEVLKESTPELMALPGVVGTAQGLCEKKPCIKVLVIEKTPDLERKIPEILDGYTVRIEATGKIRALPEKDGP